MKSFFLPLIKALFWKVQSLLFFFKTLQSPQELQSSLGKINELDISYNHKLSSLLTNANIQDLEYFNPHSFSFSSFTQLLKANHYRAWGVFLDEQLIGYSFVRCTFPNKAFAGYFIHPNHRQQGLAKELFLVSKKFAKLNQLNLFTTVSPKNIASIKTSSQFKQIGSRSNGDWILEHEL